MKTLLKPWVRLPTRWIEEGGLRSFRWATGVGSNNTAALLVLMAIAHRVEDDTGLARITYDDLMVATHLSRAKVAAGLDVLEELGLIKREPEGRSSYLLIDYDPFRGWGKLPCAAWYRDGYMLPFLDFKLRHPSELAALKLLLLVVSRRDRETNLANLSYDKIQEYSGIERQRIKSGLSLLAVQGLVHVERVRSAENPWAVSNAYRLANIEPYRHMGTTGRALEGLDTAPF